MSLKERLKDRAPKCFPCKWIMEDLEANQKLTNYPGVAIDGSVAFPIEGKVRHLMLEELWDQSLESIVQPELLKKVKSELRKESEPEE